MPKLQITIGDDGRIFVPAGTNKNLARALAVKLQSEFVEYMGINGGLYIEDEHGFYIPTRGVPVNDVIDMTESHPFFLMFAEQYSSIYESTLKHAAAAASDATVLPTTGSATPATLTATPGAKCTVVANIDASNTMELCFSNDDGYSEGLIEILEGIRKGAEDGHFEVQTSEKLKFYPANGRTMQAIKVKSKGADPDNNKLIGLIRFCLLDRSSKGVIARQDLLEDFVPSDVSAVVGNLSSSPSPAAGKRLSGLGVGSDVSATAPPAAPPARPVSGGGGRLPSLAHPPKTAHDRFIERIQTLINGQPTWQLKATVDKKVLTVQDATTNTRILKAQPKGGNTEIEHNGSMTGWFLLFNGMLESQQNHCAFKLSPTTTQDINMLAGEFINELTKALASGASTQISDFSFDFKNDAQTTQAIFAALKKLDVNQPAQVNVLALFGLELKDNVLTATSVNPSTPNATVIKLNQGLFQDEIAVQVSAGVSAEASARQPDF